VIDAPAGSMTPELKAALAAHKPRLLAMLAWVDDRTGPIGPPAREPPQPAGSDVWTDPIGPPASKPSRSAGSDGWGPPPADRGWRAVVAGWPVEWRERWGRRANELTDGGEPWDAAEWIAYGELAPDLVEAERRREVRHAEPAPGLSDREAVAAIDRAFRDSDSAPLFEPADGYDREERAAIMEYDGGLSRADAERAAGVRPHRRWG
jgi:hypothetical protein